MHRMLKLLAFAALAGAVVTAVGAASAAAVSSPSSLASKNATKVVIGYGAPVAEQLLPQFAIDQGIFKKYGLDVKVENIHGAALVIPGLKTGHVNFDVMASPQPEEGAAAGVDLKWLTVWNAKPDVQLCVAPGIGKIKDLNGKPVGLSSTGSTTGVLLQDYLKRRGLPAGTVHLVPLGSEGAQAQSFVAGQIAGFICGPPVTQSVIQQRSGAKVIANLVSRYHWNGAGLVAYMPWVNSHKSTVQKVVSALDQAWAKWKQSPAAAVKTIRKVTNVPAAAAKAAYKGSILASAKSLVPSAAVERDVLRVLGTQLPNTKKLKASSMVDTEFTH